MVSMLPGGGDTPPFPLGDWTVQPALNRVRRGDEVRRVEPKMMDVLVHLAGRAGEVVSKDELAEAVWPDVFVTESVITRAIAGLRRALDDDARAPRYIETIAKRGYRLLARSSEVPPDQAPSGAAQRSTSAPPFPASQPTATAPGQWVRGTGFQGRRAEIHEILQGPRNGIWLLGSRGIGKTSLLRQLEWLTGQAPDGPYVPLFWDLQGLDEPEALHADFREVLVDAGDRLELGGIDVDAVEADDFLISLGRLRRGARARGRQLLLLLDEGEQLIELADRSPNLLPKLRRVLQSQDGLRTVLAASARLWKLAALRDETSPFLHGLTPPLYLGPLADEAAGELLGSLNPPIDDPTVRRTVVEQAGGHPYLLHLLATAVRRTGAVERAIDEVVAEPTVHLLFEVEFETLQPQERAVVDALAGGAGGDPGDESPDERAACLHLERLGVARRTEDGWRLANPLLARWLRQRRPGAGAPPAPDDSQKA